MKIKSFPPAVAHPPRFASLLHLTNALRRRQTALGLAALAVGLAGAHSANFPAQGDDVTPSMGLFRINIEPSFRSLMEPSGPPTSFVGYVGYNSAAGRLTSPTLVDRTTEIGRSGRNIRFYPFPGAGIPVGAGSWDTISGYSAYPAIPLSFFAAPANTMNSAMKPAVPGRPSDERQASVKKPATTGITWAKPPIFAIALVCARS